MARRAAGTRGLVGLGFVLALVAAGMLRAAAPQDAGPNPVSEVQIRRWVQDLDADSFTTREAATQRLIQAGRTAVAPVAAAASHAGLEVATRGVHILRELAFSNDAATANAAREALANLAAGRGTSAARQAATVLAMLDGLRQDRAISQLRRLGAAVRPPTVRFGMQGVHSALEIEIGDEWAGAEEDLRQLAWISDAQKLTLRGKRVKGSWLKHVGAMGNLASLVLHHVSIGDRDLAPLRKLNRLRELQVRYTPIGDGALTVLRARRSLTKIMLYGTAMSRESAGELARALPDALVDYRMGGFLGVGCSKHELGCQVGFLQPGSAAEKAGLRPNDVIVKYDGKATTDPELLTQLIGVDPVGHAATVEWLHAGRRQTAKITLGEYDD